MVGDETRDILPIEIGQQCIGSRIGEFGVHFIGGPAQMRGQNDLRQSCERMIQRQRLRIENIQTSTRYPGYSTSHSK